MKLQLQEIIAASTKIEKKEDLLPFKNKYVVYLLVFPNNKAYCGYSSNIERRWSRNNNEYKESYAVYAALKKYGEQVQRYIVSSFNNSVEALQLEKDLIDYLDLLNKANGYNLVPGGGNPPHGLQYITPEGYKKMQENGKRLANEMAALSLEEKQKIQEKMQIAALNRASQMTENERKQVYGAHNLGRIPSNARAIYQIDLTTGDIIAEFSSIRQAAITLGNESYNANIRAVASNKRKSAYGYGWRWKNETSSN